MPVTSIPVRIPRKRSLAPWLRAAYAAMCLAGLSCPPQASAQVPDAVVYRDGLVAGWADWSWCSRDLAQAATVHQGTQAGRVKSGRAHV